MGRVQTRVRKAWLTVWLWACTSEPKSSDDSASGGVCRGEEEVDGDYIPGWNHCQQPEPIEEICGNEQVLGNGWVGPGCPTFSQYASLVLRTAGVWGWAGRCSYDGGFYDVVDVDHNVIDEGVVERAIFSSEGSLISFQSYHYHVTDYVLGDGPQDCCEGRLVKGRSWGEQIEPDCSNATIYTAGDFTDAVETGLTETGDTGNPSSTYTASTGDTGHAATRESTGTADTALP